jgi:hypothetical protein
MVPPKAAEGDFLGRFREIISDPLNLLIERVPMAGHLRGDDVFLHNQETTSFDGFVMASSPRTGAVFGGRLDVPGRTAIAQSGASALLASLLKIKGGK